MSLPPEIIANLEKLREHLHPFPNAAWVPIENLHITTKFIGAWDPARLPELERLLLGIKPEAPVTAVIEELEFFPRALVARVAPSPGLMSLAANTEAALAALGIQPEKRPYHPHITLARTGSRQPKAPLAHSPIGSFIAPNFHLYESRLSVYHKLATMPLK